MPLGPGATCRLPHAHLPVPSTSEPDTTARLICVMRHVGTLQLPQLPMACASGHSMGPRGAADSRALIENLDHSRPTTFPSINSSLQFGGFAALQLPHTHPPTHHPHSMRWSTPALLLAGLAVLLSGASGEQPIGRWDTSLPLPRITRRAWYSPGTAGWFEAHPRRCRTS